MHCTSPLCQKNNPRKAQAPKPASLIPFTSKGLAGKSERMRLGCEMTVNTMYFQIIKEWYTLEVKGIAAKCTLGILELLQRPGWPKQSPLKSLMCRRRGTNGLLPALYGAAASRNGFEALRLRSVSHRNSATLCLTGVRGILLAVCMRTNNVPCHATTISY